MFGLLKTPENRLLGKLQTVLLLNYFTRVLDHLEKVDQKSRLLPQDVERKVSNFSPTRLGRLLFTFSVLQ